MELEDIILQAKHECRNFFNAANSESEPPEDTEFYRWFLRVCGRMHKYAEKNGGVSGNGTTGVVTESVVGFYSRTLATDTDGKPLTLFQIFADDLKPFRRHMFTRP